LVELGRVRGRRRCGKWNMTEPKELETFEHTKSMADMWRREVASISGGTVPPETPMIETVEAAGPPSMPEEAANASDGETKVDDADEEQDAEPMGGDSDGEDEVDKLASRGEKVVSHKRARIAAPVRCRLHILMRILTPGLL